MPISAQAQQRLARLETQAMFPYLVEVTLPDNTVYRYVNADSDIVYLNNTYSACFFNISPPEHTDKGIKDAQIVFSVLDNFWIEQVRTYDERVKCKFVALIDYDANGQRYCESLDSNTFWLTDASWNDKTIQFTMKFDDKMEIQMPCQKFTQFSAPGLF